MIELTKTVTVTVSTDTRSQVQRIKALTEGAPVDQLTRNRVLLFVDSLKRDIKIADRLPTEDEIDALTIADEVVRYIDGVFRRNEQTSTYARRCKVWQELLRENDETR